MGGQSSTDTQTSQQQNGTTSLLTNQNGASSTTQGSATNPWAASLPTISGILSKLNPLISNSGINDTQQQGIDLLKSNASQGNPYAGQIGNYASDLLSGGGATAQSGAVQSGYDTLKSQIGGQADANYSSLDDPRLRAALDQIQTDVSGQINGQFAAAGRDFSGSNQNAVARGVTAAQAPLILDQFNKDRGVQQSAASTLYGAGNTTSGLLSAMQQQANTNRGAGITAADSALTARDSTANKLLTAGGLEQSLPTQALGLLAQIGIPIAGLGTTSSGGSSTATNATNSAQGTSSMTGSGTSTTTKNPSLIEELGGWLGLGSAFKALGKS